MVWFQIFVKTCLVDKIGGGESVFNQVSRTRQILYQQVSLDQNGLLNATKPFICENFLRFQSEVN